MTILEKLAEARVRFQETAPKMSGKNTFAGYSYFELADILPVINRLGKEMKFVCLVSFKADDAILSFQDTETAEQINFTSPMSTASLKGCHEVQNLGAVETYIKRYLYQNAFEIVESDAVNGTHNPNEKPPKIDNSKEIADLSSALIDYLSAGAFEHPENVQKVIDAKDVVLMRKALYAAKAKEGTK